MASRIAFEADRRSAGARDGPDGLGADERDADAPDPARRVRYRCCGCGLAFAPPEPGAAPCPRCQSIGGHERIGDGEPDRFGGDERE